MKYYNQIKTSFILIRKFKIIKKLYSTFCLNIQMLKFNISYLLFILFYLLKYIDSQNHSSNFDWDSIKNVTEFGLTGNTIKLNNLNGIEKLTNLTYLILIYHNFTNIGLKPLSKLHKLQFLLASNNNINIIDDSICKLRNILNLDISHNNITNVSCLSNLNKLDSLTVRRLNISSLDWIRNLTNLITLDLDDNVIN